MSESFFKKIVFILFWLAGISFLQAPFLMASEPAKAASLPAHKDRASRAVELDQATKQSFDLELSKIQSEEISLDSSAEEISSPKETLHFDLTDCVRMGLRNNAEIRGADYDIDVSKYKLQEAQPRGVPVVNYEYETAPVPKDASHAVKSFFEDGDITMVNRIKLGFGFPLTFFGKVKLAQDLARSGVSAAKEKKIQKASDIVLKIKQLYYGILFARDVKLMLEDASKKLQEEINKRETATSPVDPVDLARMKLTRYEVVRRLGDVFKKEDLAEHGLRLQMGLDRGFNFDLRDQHLKPVLFDLKDLNFYMEESKRYRPDSRLLDIAMRAKEDEYRLEKRKLAPNVGVGAFFEMGRTVSDVTNVGATNDYNDPFNYTRAGVGLRLQGEINYREAIARIKQKEAEYYKISVTKDYAEEGLNLDVRDAYLSVKQAKIDLENSEQAHRLARQVVFLTKTNVDVGVGESKDYGDALQAYLLMKGRYYESIFNYNVAVATLISKVGYQPQE